MHKIIIEKEYYFQNLSNLHLLDLSNNSIESISIYVFIDLSNLHTLKLSNNKLKFIYIPCLYILDLYVDSNNLTKINNKVFLGKKYMLFLSLRNNK